MLPVIVTLLIFLQDMYVTMIDMKWRYVVIVLFGFYFFSYFLFAVFYWVLCYMSGQFDVGEKRPEYRPCIVALDNFRDAFLFSMETQCKHMVKCMVTEYTKFGIISLLFTGVVSCLYPS